MVTENNYNEGVLTIKGIKIQKKKMSMKQISHDRTRYYLASGIPWQITSLTDLRKKRKA